METDKQLLAKLLLSRMRILIRNPFYGQLLMSVKLGLDETCLTAYACGNKICFSPEFLSQLTDDEIDFVLHHEILHIVLKHCYRYEPKNRANPELFNIACDMVVDSTIYKSFNNDESKIIIQGEKRWHKLPNGEEASNYTVEQVFNMLFQRATKLYDGSSDSMLDGLGDDLDSQNDSDGNGSGKSKGNNGKNSKNKKDKVFKDNHNKWEKCEDSEILNQIDRAIVNTIKNVKRLEENNGITANSSCGAIPAFAERIFKDLTKPKLNWRIILNNFIQEEVNDYSFSPPDRRFEGPFYLPDFNDMIEKVKDVLFMIDTSGSMSQDDITKMYSEINGAICQFAGKLQGWLGFFDAEVIPPVPFSDDVELKKIKAKGGGGTNFHCIYEYVFNHMKENLPIAIIILTDGYAPFPKIEDTKDIPTLWILNNNEVKPPYGKVVVIEKED